MNDEEEENIECLYFNYKTLSNIASVLGAKVPCVGYMSTDLSEVFSISR